MELIEWMNFTRDAAAEIAAGALGVESIRWQHPTSETLPADLCGVYIPLMADGYSLQIGILGRPDACTRLAKSLLGMGPEEDLADESEVFDAVGEVTNMVAGGVKVRAAAQINVKLGLPLALHEAAIPLSNASSEHGLMQMDENAVWLVVTGSTSA